jgi:hypothetical protein
METICNQHRRWSADGTYQLIVDELRRGADVAEGGHSTHRWTRPVDGVPIVLVWVSCGAVGLTRAGERVAVWGAFGFRRPSPAQAAALQPRWAAALRLSATPASEVDLYVQRSRQPNAHGRRGQQLGTGRQATSVRASSR